MGKNDCTNKSYVCCIHCRIGVSANRSSISTMTICVASPNTSQRYDVVVIALSARVGKNGSGLASSTSNLWVLGPDNRWRIDCKCR